MQRKIAAILAADVAGYSRLVASNEDDALKRLLRCREIFADLIGKAGGRIFNTAGDAVLAECPSAIGALQAAIDIQESLRTCNLDVPAERQMLFRIGITIGDVMERDGDLLGDGVNIAARLEALAQPGGICISRNMFEQIGNKIDVKFRDIGLQTVKNLPAPIHAFLLAAPDHTSSPKALKLHLSAAKVGSIGAALVIIAAAGVFAFLKLPRAHSEGERYFGFFTQPGSDAAPRDMPFDPERIPFVCAGCRAEIAAAASQGSNNAVALSDTGAYGYASNLPMVDDARETAMKGCTNHRRGDGVCQLYAVNGVVVWPHALSMPPHPWIDPTIRSGAFDATKIGGAWAEQFGVAFNKKYGPAEKHKAVALDSDGHWFWRSRMETEQEAVQTVLELCANRTGSFCRVVALDDSFVVRPSSRPTSPEEH